MVVRKVTLGGREGRNDPPPPVCRAYIMMFSMNAIKNNIQPLPEGKNADENNRSYLDALQKKRIALFLNIVTL